MRTQLLLAAIGLALSANVSADASDGEGDRSGHRLRVTAGVSASTGQSAYPGDDSGVRFRPWFSLRWGPVYYRGRSLGATVHQGDEWTVKAGVYLDGRDTDRGGSSQVSDMAELDRAVLGEVDVSRDAAWGVLDFSFAADVSGKHGGYLAGLSYGYPFVIGPVRVKPKVGIGWQSAEVVRYYYGVSADDVRPDRPLHEPGGGVNFELGVTVTYPVAKRHTLQFRAGAVFLSPEISRSPIVVRDRLAKLGVGYVYRFR